MATSRIFRNSFRARTQRQNRWDVLWFAVVCIAWIAAPFVCGDWKWGAIQPTLILGYVLATSGALLSKRTPGERKVYVTSLDDRAFLHYGKTFLELSEEQQNDVMSRYQVGVYILTLRNEEDIQARAGIYLRAKHEARKILLWAVPLFVCLCLLLRYLQLHGILHMPPGTWASVLLCGGLTAWVLPQLLTKWREPDNLPPSAYLKTTAA